MWQGTTDDGCVALADLLGWKVCHYQINTSPLRPVAQSNLTLDWSLQPFLSIGFFVFGWCFLSSCRKGSCCMKFVLNLELFKPTRPLDPSLLLLILFSRIAFAAMSPTEAQRRSVVEQTTATFFLRFLQTFYAVCSSPRLTAPWNSSEDWMKLSKFGGNFCERNVFLSLC